MRLVKWLAPIVTIAFVVTAGGGVAAREVSSPDAAQVQRWAPRQDDRTQPGTLPAPSAVPPDALQTRGGERRDLLRQRPEEMPNTYDDPRGPMPAWFANYDAAVERNRDAHRAQYREQRDFYRQRNSSWMDNLCPWSKPRHNRSAQRNYQRQMEQLDRREVRDTFMSQPPSYVPWPARW